MTTGSSQSAELMRLAELTSQPKSRLDQIYLAVATLFEQQKGGFSERERQLASDILKRLTKEVEMSIRIALAERLAEEPNVPHELIVLLVNDKIEVARPVLARSPVLSDDDLLQVIRTGSFEHQIAVAERPAIGETVSAAIARSECEAAVIALLRNQTAVIGAATFDFLAERARSSDGMQEPLVARRDLPSILAGRLYGWVSEGLKTALLKRYPHVAQALSQAIDQTTVALQSGKSTSSELSAKKLVEKLSASGQLRSSFLIRVLNQGQMDLFEHGLAALLQMDVEPLRKTLYGPSPLAVALACRAAGIDRSVFMTVFNLSRHHRKVSTTLSDSERSQIHAIFSEVPKFDALTRLRASAAG